MGKYKDFEKKDFISLITKLNTRIIFLQKEKSKQWFQGKTMQYRTKNTKDLILKFLQKDCKHSLDDIPSIGEYSLQDFRKRLSQYDDDF